MIDVLEYIQGKPEYQNRIAMLPMYSEIESESFYPVVAIRDDDDNIDIGEIMDLEKRLCKVYSSFQSEPIMKMLYMDDFIGYEIKVSNGV